jgi:hypothetical protein
MALTWLISNVRPRGYAVSNSKREEYELRFNHNVL